MGLLLNSCIDWNYLSLRHTNRFIIWMPNVFMICFNSIILHMKQGHINLFNLNERPPCSNGLRTFSYLGSKLWNDLVNLEPAIANVEFDELIEFLKDWEDPNTNDGFPYVWQVPCLIFLCILRITFLHMSFSDSFLCIPYFMYISTAL